MNEVEVKKLEQETLAGVEIDPTIELNWSEEQVKALRGQLQVFAAQFKMWKHMRNDKLMKEAAGKVKEAKDLIGYFEGRIKELRKE